MISLEIKAFHGVMFGPGIDMQFLSCISDGGKNGENWINIMLSL